MNEFFLIALALLCSLIRGNDRSPALIYGLIVNLFYWGRIIWPDNVASLFIAGVITDLLVVTLLACLRGCLRSILIYFLMPLSFVSAVMHFFGYVLYESGGDFTVFNSIVTFYMFVILALFALSAGGYGNICIDNRLFHRDNSDRKNMAMVVK